MPSFSIPHSGKVEFVGLDPSAEPDALISLLSELNSTLVLASSQPLSRSLLSTVRVLVELMGNASEEVAFLASRAFTYIFDICPQSAAAAVEAGVVRALSGSLLSIADMDIAEQSLNCLCLLAREMPRAVLEGGGIKACVEFYDFFSQELQGLALRSVSCMCAAVDRESHVSYVLDTLPILCAMLYNKDSIATARGANLCFERLCSSLSSPLQSNRVSSWQVSFLEKLANCGVVEHWIRVLQDVGQREGVRAGSPLPSDVFGYKRRQQTVDGQKARPPSLTGGTLAGILCSLAKLVATAPTVLHLVYKLDVARVIGTLLESFISQQYLKVDDGVAETQPTASASASSCGQQSWSTGTISCTTPDFQDVSADERLLQAMTLAVALLPPPGEYANKSIKTAEASGMNEGEEGRDESEKKSSSIMFKEEEEMVVSSMKVKVPSVLELGVQFPWHDSNGRHSIAQWNCLICMFSNYAYALRCHICGTVKSSLVPISVLPPPSIASKANSRDTIPSLQTSSSSSTPPDHKKLNQAEASLSSSSIPCDSNTVVFSQITRYDVYDSSPVYLKAYVAHGLPHILRLVRFCSNETVLVLILSTLESLFDLGYLPSHNILWDISGAIGQFLSSPNMDKNTVRAVSLARKFLEAHDFYENSSDFPLRHDWWWGEDDFGKWSLHHRFGVVDSIRKTRETTNNNYKPISGRADDSYRAMYIRHGIVYHITRLLKSLCSSFERLGRHEQCMVLQTNLKCIILETEVLAFMSVFASSDKWILTALNNVFPQQSKSKAVASSIEQQTPLISHRHPHIKKHNNQQQLEDAPPAMSLVSILLGGWRSKVIPASSLDEMEKKTIALLAAAAAGDDNDAVGTNTAAVEVQESNVLRELLAVAELLKKGPQLSLKNAIFSEENDHREHKGGIGSILTSSPSCCTTTQSPSYQSMNLPRGDIRCCSSSEAEENDPNLVALITILEREEDVTVHEMRESKILEALLDYFFVTVKYPLPSMQYMGRFFKTFSNGSSSSLGRLRVLFNKIQECLTAAEAGSFCRNIVHHNGKTDAVRYNGLLHPFFVRVVSSKTLLEATDDGGGGQETLKTSGEDANSTSSPIVLIEPLTTVKEASAFIRHQISSLTTTRKLAVNRKDMDAIKGLPIDLERAHHLKNGCNELVNHMYTNYSHMSIGKGCQCSTPPPEDLYSVSEAEAFLQDTATMKRFRGGGEVFNEGERVAVNSLSHRKRLKSGGGEISKPSSACLPDSTATVAAAQNLKKKGKRQRHRSCGEAAASSSPPKPGSVVYVYLINGEDKLPVCRKCTVLAMRDDGTCDVQDTQYNTKGGIIREAVPLTHVATSPILLPFRKRRHYALFQREVMNDRLVLPEQQIECTRQKGIFLNRSIKGGYRIPMLRRMMLGMVYEGQRVITRRKVQVLYPQGLQLQQQCSPQQTNVHAQEGTRVMSSGTTSSTSSITVLPSTGIGRTRNECQSDTNIYSDAASSASIVPEEEAIAWRMKYVSKSGEEYVIDLSLLPPSTTIFEVVQKLLYMCKRGERGGGEEISAANNNNHKSIVVGPEEWEHTYYIELNLKVLNHDHQLVKPKPKPNEDKDWIAPDVLHYSRTSFDATLHHMIRCFRDNKDFWAPAGNLATVLHLLAVLQVLLDERQWRFCTSSSPMTLLSPLLGQTRSLSSKLLRQCCDPLSLCTETLPEWCRILPSSLPSLLTLESRMILFFRTAVGSSHSLDAIQDMSRVVEEETGGGAANSTTFEDGGSSCSSFSLEFDSGGSDSTMLTNHNLTLFQRLGHLGRLKRLRVVVSRNNILPVSCTLFSALVDGERDEKEQRTFVRIEGIGWRNESRTICGFPVMLKVDDADELLDNDEEEGMGNANKHVGVKNGTTTAAAAAHSLTYQREEDTKILHAMDCDTGHSAPPSSGGGGVFNHGLDSILLVEFEGETGYGTGPTQEFYTLICQEMRKPGLGLWHHDNDKTKCTFLNPPEGLYPKPHPPGSKELNSAISLFLLLGRVIGKSLKDGHQLDLPLSLPLCKILVGEEGGLILNDVEGINVMTGQCLKHVLSLFYRLSTPECTAGDDEEAKMLCLTWSLPGCAWYALRPKEKGYDEDVKPEDFGQWDLLCGMGGKQEEATWTYNAILNSIVVGHGYTLFSRQVLDLVAIMSDFSKEERRDFLSFTTGTPRLPIGGFGALSPCLTIVHKAVNNGGKPDDFLPSCSTCQVYLKLPAYSSRDIMKAKLLHAISDGQGHFALD